MSRLTLTFDNGPCPGATDRILDILAERGFRATFFVLGKHLADPVARRCAERAHDEGHWIGNHTTTHGTPLGLTDDPDHCETEIGATQALLGDLAHPDRLFRPHGKGAVGPHLLSRAAAKYLAANRYTVVTWNNVPRDWEAPHEHWIGTALETMDSQDWSLLVLHDRIMGKVPDTLPHFLDIVAERGVDIVQPFPEDCVAMGRGRALPALAQCIMAETTDAPPG